MFFSTDLLLKRDGRFALIWRIATKAGGSKKTNDKQALLSIDIADICDDLMKYIPAGGSSREEPRNKFSLYLLGQLVYGISVVLSKQVVYLELDVRAAYESCMRVNKNIFDSILMERSGDDRKRDTKKKKKRTQKIETARGLDFDMDDLRLPGAEIRDFADLDVVGEAMRYQITLADPVPDWKTPAIFADDLLPLNQEELMEMGNFANTTVTEKAGSTRSKDSLEQLLGVSSSKQKTRPPDFDLDDILGQTSKVNYSSILDPFPNMLDPQQQNISGVPLQQQQQDFPDWSLPAQRPEFPDMPLPLGTPVRQEDNTAPITVDGSLLARETQLKRPISDMLQLEELMETPRKKKRKLFVMQEDNTMISWNSIKDMINDFSSLVRPIEEVRINKKPSRSDGLDVMLGPLPTSYRVPKQLHYLYKKLNPDKITLAEAANIDPLDPTARGPEEKLWRYTSSESDASSAVRREDQSLAQFAPLDDDLRLPGIAFLKDTPEKIKNNTLEEQSYQLDRTKAFDGMDPMMIGAQPFPDIVDLQLETGRRSQVSALEEARRSTFEPSSRLENRTGSLLLGDNPHVGYAGIQDVARSDDVSKLDVTVDKSGQRILQALRHSDGEPVSFFGLFPSTSVNRKQAARAFNSLLGLIKTNNLKVDQAGAYEDILIRGEVEIDASSGMSALNDTLVI